MTIVKLAVYLSVLLTPFSLKKQVMDREESVKAIYYKKKSLIRLGDAEFRMMINKKGLSYQEYNSKLRDELKQIIKRYKQKDPNYILCVPYEPFTKEAKWMFKKENYKYLMCFGIYRFYFRYFMPKHNKYGCSFLFIQENEKNYHRLWQESKNVIFIHNDPKWAEVFKKKYDINTIFIEIPNKNCYSHIEKIQKKIEKKINEIKKEGSYSVIISAGPAAKVLVYRLAEKGILSYDVGHCWDDPLVMEK